MRLFKGFPWLILMLGLTFFVDNASAAQTGDYTSVPASSEVASGNSDSDIYYAPGTFDGPTTDDVMLKMLASAIGGDVYKAREYISDSAGGSGGVTVVAQMLMLAPGMAIILAGIIACYTLFGGLINSGRDGQFLGRKWDSWYVPFRTGVSVASLYPCPGFAGMSFIQAVVLALALFGVGMASAIWRYAVDNLVSNAIIMPDIPSIDSLSKTMLEAQMCSSLKNLYDTNNISPEASTTITAPLQASNCSSGASSYIPSGCISENATNSVKTTYIGSANSAVCGAVTYKPQITITANHTGSGTNAGEVFKIYYNALTNTHESSISSLTASLSSIASKLVDDNTTKDEISSMADGYVSARNNYSSSLLSSVSGLNSDSNINAYQSELKTTMKKGGFAVAGAYIYGLTDFQNGVQSSILASMPGMTFDRNAILKTNVASMEGFKEQRERAYSRLEQLNKLISGRSFTGKDVDSVGQQLANANGDSVFAQALGSIVTDAAKSMTNAVLNQSMTIGDVTTSTPDPLVGIKYLGNKIEAMHFTMMGALVVANMAKESGAGEFVNFFSGSSGAVDIVSSYVIQLIPMIFAIGFLFSNVIPALPYIMWYLAVIGYLTYVLESVMAAPFWVSMHAHPEGHEVTGHGSSGYPILLTLVLKPSLMIFGIVFAMAIVRIGYWLLGETFFGQWQIMNAGGFNIYSLIGCLVMYGAAMAATIYKSYSLTYELPNALLRWMGVGAHHADLGEKEAESRVAIISGRMGSAFSAMPHGDPGGRHAAGAGGGGNGGSGGSGGGSNGGGGNNASGQNKSINVLDNIGSDPKN